MSEAGHGHELIIIRRHEEEEHEHHSSAWKVAHADFMTAMMAFFLIMWLISVTDDEVRKGISEYFNPIHMSQGSSDLKGLNKPSPGDEKSKGKGKGHSDAPLPGEMATNLLELSAGHADSKSLSPEAAASALQAAAEVAAKIAAAAGKGGAAEGPADKPGGAGGAGLAQALAALAEKGRGTAAEGDRAAFQNPYAVLTKLAEDYVAEHPSSTAVIEGDVRAVGTEGGAADRDPFDPSYWQLSPLPEARAVNPGRPGSATKPPPGARPDAAAVRGEATAESAQDQPVAVPQADAAAPATTIAESKALAAEIEKSVARVVADGASPAISVTATAEGVLINLTDDARYSMFGVGSAVPDAKTVVLLGEIAGALSSRQGEVVVRGFTDGRPFRSADYDNWRLSAARAHMAYYMLTRGGLPEARVVAIEGHADRSLKNPAEPYAAENRRIEVLLKEPHA